RAALRARLTMARRRTALAGAAAAITVALGARAARADDHHLAASGYFGLELAGVAPGALGLRSDTSFALRPVLPGTAFGGALQMRLHPLRVGLELQRTQFIREHLFSDKLYASVGVALPVWQLLVIPAVEIGYADLGGDRDTVRGLGGKAMTVVELPLDPAVLVGAGASLDGIGYATRDGALRSIGGTFSARLELRF
ncbi:MAG TPA: hypothetical protein VHB21_28315, partial [Minicystis sp.]|nr:hypothetical protein [Minicystis sp.]